MAAYYKVDVVLNSQAVQVGLPSPQSVRVTLPLRGPQGLQGIQGEVGPVGPVGQTGSPGADGREVELQTTESHVQWRYEGESEWTDLVALSAITGPQGTQGETGLTGAAGADGREVELRKTETHVQWRYEGEAEYTDLIALTEITGPQGQTGDQGPAGPANTLAIGTVTTGAAGTEADATLTGDSPAQTLNLVIPRGDKGDQGDQGPPGTATTDASALTTGTLADARLSSNVPLLDAANTYSANQTLDGTNNVAPNQTAASGSSLLTRLLGDLRYGAWENTQEIVNFTGATAGVVSGGSTTFAPATTQLRGASGGGFRSFRADMLTTTTGAITTVAAGGWLSQAIVCLLNDSRCFAAYYPVAGTLSAQWAGRAPGVLPSGAVTPYFLFRDGSWRAIKATFVRGSTSVFPVRASNVITVETNGNHNLVVGDYVAVGGVAPQSFQTVYSEVTGTPTSTSFTYANTGANETGTTILGDNMHIYKVEELGSIAASIASNVFTGTRTWYLSIQLSATGDVTYIANGTTVATGSGFNAGELVNIGRVAFYVESLAAATSVSDFFIYKVRHTINP